MARKKEKNQTKNNNRPSKALCGLADIENFRCYVADRSPSPFAVTQGEAHVFRYVNPAFCGLTGKQNDALLGQPFGEALPQSRENGSLALLDRVYRTGEVERIAGQEHLHPERGTVYWTYSVSPILDEQGRSEGLLLQAVETTEQVVARRSYEEVAERMQEINQRLLISGIRQQELAGEAEVARQQVANILESITDAFFTLDYEWRVTYVNGEAERLMRKTRQELMGKNLWDEFPEAVGTTFYTEYHRAMLDQVPVQFEEYYPPFNTWFEVHAYPSRDGLSVYFQDINQRVWTEEALRDSEEKYRVLYQEAPHAYFTIGTDSYIRMANRHAVEMVGYAMDDLIGRPVFELYANTPAGEEKARKVFARFRAGEEIREEELEMRRADGEPVWISLTVLPVRDAEGQVVESRSMAVDITERKRGEEAVAQLAAIVESSDDAILSKTLDGIITSWNPGAERLYGYSAKEAVGKPVSILIPPDHAEELPAIMGRLKRGENIEHYDTVRARKDGSRVDVSMRISPMKDTDGQIIGASAIARDIAERKQAEEERERLLERLDAERLRLEAILETVPVGVVLVEADGHVSMANREAERLLGQPKEQIFSLPRRDRGLHHPAGKPYIPEELPFARALMSGQTSTGMELVVTRPDDSTVHLLFNSLPVTDPEGHITAAVTAFLDVTPLRELERQREEFISIVTHDLRGVLTIIRGYADYAIRLAPKDTLPEQVLQSLQEIASSSRRMDKMTSDLLDISRIEARRLALTKEQVDLPSLTRAIVQRSGELTKGHPVRVEVRGEAPLVEADPDRIEQVLSNLLSNAGKYSFPGSEITIEVEPRPREVMVSVTNLGPGILPDGRERIFSRFHRARLAVEDRIPGLGLGLYIAKGLVEAHGGRIWVQSEPGEYATFRFTLPVASGK